MKITANMVTVTRIVLMPVPGWLLYQGAGHLFVCLAVISILGITDYIDGIMARREGPTVLGGLLDPIADKIFIAVIYLPLTERYVEGWDRAVIPLWMTMCIFARDFLVTSLRTSLMLRGAPMRTSTLAKFKTAIQMVGAGYIIFYLAVHLADPDHWITWLAICAPTLVPLSLIVYRLFARKKQGLRSWSMLALMIVAVAIRRVFDADVTSYILLLAITGITVYSGMSYLADAWGALKGAPGGIKEAGRFVLDGLLVPMAFLALLGRFEMPGLSAAIITAFSLELSAGGLANVLASHKVVPRFRWLALKSLLLVAFAGAALLVWKLNLFEGLPVGEALTLAACGVSVGYTVLSFWRRRRIYLAEIRKPSAPAA